MTCRFFQLDAFTTQRFRGNPAAVVVLGEQVERELRQSIAAENNLAETAFLVLRGSDYEISWFTPLLEVPLCGHATLASAAVVMERLEPGRDSVTFHSLSGPLMVQNVEGGYRMDFPARPSTAFSGFAAEVLGVEPVEIYVNEFNYMAVLSSASEVRGLRPDLEAVAGLDRLGLIVTAPGDEGYDIVSRYFAPAKGIDEDPVTGGAHCSLVPYWCERLGKVRLRAYQASARGGELGCELVGDRVRLSGACVFVIEGQIEVGR